MSTGTTPDNRSLVASEPTQASNISKGSREGSPACACFPRLRTATFVILLVFQGCGRGPYSSTDQLIEQLSDKSEYTLALKKEDKPLWPQGVDVNDGLSEQECIQLALHNNAGFQAELARLGLAGADRVQAGEITNPSYSLLLPLGRADFESTFGLPVEFLWLRPMRLEIAQRALDAEAESLLQAAHEIASDVRSARVEVVYARWQLELAQEEAIAHETLQHLANQAFAAGGTTGLAVEESNVAGTLARQRILHHEHAVEEAELRLWALLGIEEVSPDSDLPAPDTYTPTLPALEELKEAAMVSRPDLRAASLRVAQASEACRLSRHDWIKLSGLLDADLPDGKARIAPGVKFDIPLFNQGRGGQARAAAELDLAARRYVALRWEVVTSVTQAYARVEQGRAGVSLLRASVLPTIESHIASLAQAQAAGLSLPEETEKARLRLIDARMTLNEEARRLARACIELDRAVACQCDGLRLAPANIRPSPGKDLVTRKDD